MPNAWGQNAVYLQSGDPETENVASLLYPGQLGTRFTVIEPTRTLPSKSSGAGRPKRYQLIQSDSSMTVAPYRGAVGWWSDQSKYLVTTNSPTTAQTRNRLAGVFVNAITPGNYGCVLITGLGIVKLIDAVTQANVVSGAFVIPSSTNGKADVTASATAPVQLPIGTVSDPLAFTVTDLTVLTDVQMPDSQ